jgi:magnesium transporter
MCRDLGPDQFDAALEDEQGLLWVDFVGEPPERCEPILRETFGFHPLAVDDALQESHVPKVDDWGSYLYVVLHAVVMSEGQDERLDTLELDIFLGENYLVTHHDHPIPVVDRVWELWLRDERHRKKGPDHVLYQITDELAASYMPVVEQIDSAIEGIEDQIFDQPSRVMLEQLFSLKRAVLNLRRIITPQREVLNKLARDDYRMIDTQDQVYFRDVYDHLVRMYGINESMRELVSSAMETYLSAVNNRLNEVVKTLTIITTLFMPISFITGFFGMNFFQPVVALEAWTSLPAFVLVLAAVIAIPVSLYVWMRRRAWM